jgi:hypothetical protein
MQSLVQTSQRKFKYPFLLVFDTLLNSIPLSGLTITHVERVRGYICAKVQRRLFLSNAEMTFVVQVLRENLTLVRMESEWSSGLPSRFARQHEKMSKKIAEVLASNLESRIVGEDNS